MGRPLKNSLSFFSVFNKDRSSEKLKFPPAYTLHMLGTLPQRVFLRDQYGNIWPLKLANIENQLYFEEGWAKFVKDNSIETGDFVFFQYDDNKLFHVKLIGSNDCDKEGFQAPKSKEKEKEYLEPETIDEESEEGSDEEIEELENQTLKEQVVEEIQEDNDEELEEHESQLFNKHVKRELAKIRKEVQSLERRIGTPRSEGIDKGLRESSRAKDSQKKDGAKRGRTKYLDHYGAEIFRSQILPIPKNPYFVTKIRPKRRHELYIPNDVLKDYSITKLPDKATLRDSRGRTWSTNLSSWIDGRKFYVGGWESFCRLNFVRHNDLCICEFVKASNQEDLVIQLQVVPTKNNSIVCQQGQQRT